MTARFRFCGSANYQDFERSVMFLAESICRRRLGAVYVDGDNAWYDGAQARRAAYLIH